MSQLRITFLGTSAGMPSRDRNVACVAMTLDGRTLLFDCGEATQHQLMRSGVRLGSIDAVFLTHLHGDHLFGLPGLLASMSLNGRTAPLTVVGPEGLRRFLAALPHFHTTFEVQITEPELMPMPDVAPAPNVAPALSRRSQAARYRIAALPVEHSAPCFAYALIEEDSAGVFDVDRAAALGVHPGPDFGRLQRGETVGEVKPSDVLGPPRRGRRIVYCTDTRPCAAVVDLARDADLLIHEATYGDDMADEARERYHSTAREAATVARDAGAARLILTHISPRYLDPLPLLEQAREVFPNTDLAADLACHDLPRPL